MYGANSYGSTTYGDSGKRSGIYILVVSVGSFVLTGVNNVLTKSLNLITSVASFTLTGVDVVLTKGIGYAINVLVGTFALTGIDVILKKGLNMITSVGEFALTGIDAAFIRGIKLIAETGVFSIVSNAFSILINGTTTYFSKRVKPAIMSLTNRTKPTTNYSTRTKPTTIWTERTKP